MAVVQTKKIEPITIEAKWLTFRRQFTTTVLTLVEEDYGNVRVEYAKTDIEFTNESEWSYNWREEEVRKPHPKSEKRYFTDVDGKLKIQDGDLEVTVNMTLPAEPCLIARRSFRQIGFNEYAENIDVECNDSDAVHEILARAKVIYPANKWECWNLRNFLYDWGFKWNKNQGAYVRY